MRKPASNLIAVEVVLSLATLAGIWWLFFNVVAAYWCFGGCEAEPSQENIWRYRVGAVATVVAVVGTFAAAWRRRARWAWVWHTLIAMAALASVVTFAVPEPHLELSFEPAAPSHPQCMSPGPECDRLGG